MRPVLVALLLAIASPAAADAGVDAARVEGLLSPIASEDAAARGRAADAAGALGPEAVPAIAAALEGLRKERAPEVAQAVRAAGGVGRDGADLCERLLATDADGPGWVTAVKTAALLRALAHVATTPALREVVKVANDHGQAFRPEVARVLTALGDKAVPALLETRTTPLRAWGYGLLESMGKRMAADAVLTADNHVLADVLRAFANVHDVDALPVVLAFVSSDRREVRDAAREAVVAYGQDALPKLREAYANVTGKEPAETWTAADVARELFAAHDRYRQKEVYGLLDEGLAKEKTGDLEGAVAAFDKVLARQPMLDRRGETVGAYVTYARQIEDDDPVRALALFKKAARLAPNGPRTAQIDAEIAYLNGKELLARGIDDEATFRRAVTLDPSHTKARRELERIENEKSASEERTRWLAAAVTAALVAIAGAVLFAGRRRPRRAALVTGERRR